MDVDGDIDSTLLQQFSSMGTTDKEVLISQLQKLLGNQLNPAGCAFFLDMNNWNLPAAIGAYYDLEQPNGKIPCAALVKDITVGEGESVSPNVRFTKTWSIQNTGEEPWPPGCSLKYTGGEQFGHRDRVMVDPLAPGNVAEVSVEMTSPSDHGLHQGQWRMSTATGMYFGEIVWVILQVEETGILSVTQQLSSIGHEFGASTNRPNAQNPFASPSKNDLHNQMAVGLYGGASPASSVIAQHGSTPNSPQDRLPEGMELPFHSPNTSQVRTLLFPTANSPADENSSCQQQDMMQMDSLDMT